MDPARRCRAGAGFWIHSSGELARGAASVDWTVVIRMRLEKMPRRRSRWLTATFLGVFGVALVCLPTTSGAGDAGDDGALPPLYLTIIVHNEEDTSRGVVPKSNIPDYDGSEETMAHFAFVMRVFSEMAAGHGAKIDFGSDWTFSRGVALYEPTFYEDLEAMGHDIDAHAHESSILYHEVRGEIVAAGGSPTHVASGMDETTIRDQLAYFDERYPEFEILWGAALPGHTAGECAATWVWRPARGDWTTHDPEGRYIYVGNGELVNSIQAIRRAVENRDPNRVNTYAVFLSPREFKAAPGTAGIDDAWIAATDSIHFWRNRIAWWDGLLRQIRPLVDAGVVEYATLTQIAEIFVNQEDDLVFDWDEMPRSEAGMRQRNILAGYPLE